MERKEWKQWRRIYRDYFDRDISCCEKGERSGVRTSVGEDRIQMRKGKRRREGRGKKQRKKRKERSVCDHSRKSESFGAGAS